jgi:hypothetical protein
MSHIFISYANADGSDVAHPLAAALEATSRPCWIAPRDVLPGMPYSGQIVRAIRDCGGLVLLLTPGANLSAAVLAEVELAHNERKVIAALMVRGTEPSDDLRFFLSSRHRIAWSDASAVAAALGKVFTATEAAAGRKVLDIATADPSPQSVPPSQPQAVGQTQSSGRSLGQTLGHWVCFAPQDYARVRNYKVISHDPAVGVEVSNAFELHAESAWPRSDGAPEVWQYLFLGPGGYSVLMRDAEEERDGATAAVVWGLLLPFTYVTSPRFNLEACSRAFPPRQWSHARWPEPLDLDRLPAPAGADDMATRLAAGYVQSGSVRVNAPDVRRVLPVFCRAIERLAPEDRLTASFSTRHLDKRAIETDPAAGPLPTADQGLALLKLWRSLEGAVQGLPDRVEGFPEDLDMQVYRSVTLRGNSGEWGWLLPLLRRLEDLTRHREYLKDLPEDIQLALLSGGFERFVRTASADEVLRTMDQMARDGMLVKLATAIKLRPIKGYV